MCNTKYQFSKSFVLLFFWFWFWLCLWLFGVCWSLWASSKQPVVVFHSDDLQTTDIRRRGQRDPQKHVNGHAGHAKQYESSNVQIQETPETTTIWPDPRRGLHNPEFQCLCVWHGMSRFIKILFFGLSVRAFIRQSYPQICMCSSKRNKTKLDTKNITKKQNITT